MAYADATYYNEDYKGIKAQVDGDLEQALERASDDVDELTQYKIKSFDDLTVMNQKWVRKATAIIAESYLLQGGYESAKSEGLGNVKLGSFGYSDPGSSSSSNKNTISSVPSKAVNLLNLTGLMYSGLNVRGNGINTVHNGRVL